MKKKILLLFFVLFSIYNNAQTNSLWKRINSNKSALKNSEKTLQYELNKTLLLQILSETAVQDSKKKGNEIEFPNTKGELEKFNVWESSNFAPELQKLYPNIRAYAGIGINDPTATIHFSISQNGIQTMTLRADSGSEFIEQSSGDKSIYVLSNSESITTERLPFTCSTDDVKLNNKITNRVKANNKTLKTFRLALSCNGEYSSHFGNTVEGVLGGMNATMTRVNGVLNKDFAVKFEIIANNNQIIYLDPNTDPYSDASLGADNPLGAKWNIELQENLTKVITNNNYDIGHLFAGSGGGGNAGCIGCICENPTVNAPRGKGSGYSAPGNIPPIGDFFDIDIVAHEMGHQLGANHTFSHKIEGTGANIEPGSGSTIMGYAGVTNYNVQMHSDDYYSVNSILQIQSNLSSKASIDKETTNNPPLIDAGLNHTIPKGTAFVLKGTGTDQEGDNVSYCWEQNDSAITQIDANSTVFSTKIDGPLFRSLYPSSTPIRYMPALKDVLANKLSTKWESVSTIGRVLNFSLTARDNAISKTAQTATDFTTVTISENAGPFEFTSQSTSDIGWTQNTTERITWNVNGSENLDGSATVNIKLSTDGGMTFPISLASNTPNDGIEEITVPDIKTTNCRLLIEPVNNIYYTVNKTVFAIGYNVTSACNTYTFDAPYDIPETKTFMSKTITVPSGLDTITNVTVNIGVTHTFMSDIEIELISSQGTIVKLLNKNCGNSSLKLNFDDQGNPISCSNTAVQKVSPAEPLNILNGQNPQNEWTLRFRDPSNGDIGKIDNASLTICTKKFTSLSEKDFKIDSFMSYPNPSKGTLNIQFNSKSTANISICVYDLLGRKLFDEKYPNKSSFNEEIKLKNINPGIYVLKVIDGDRKEEKKIIIE
ncbi:Secretion system C-terminal sorting domain [Flavobacteriaceae bacterium]